MLKTTAHSWDGEAIPSAKIESVEIASEDSVKRIGGRLDGAPPAPLSSVLLASCRDFARR